VIAVTTSKTMKRLFALGGFLLAGPGAGVALPQRRSPAVDRSVTFTKDVAPILYGECATCHQPDGPAPFSLITYDDARRHAAQIVSATARRYMPPWKPERGYGEFVGERRLSDAQIATIRLWAATGRLEGNASDLPEPPRFSSGWQIGEPDLVVTIPEYTLRAQGTDVFRNFVIAVPGSGTRYVRALEFRPGNRAVHHANIRIDPTPASRRLDEADPEPGYEGVILHSADYPDGHFLGWTPGQTPPPGPNALAWRLDAGNDLVVQLHLRPTGKPERIGPSIGLYFASDPPARTPAILRLGRQSLDIPAGARDFRVVDAYVLPVDAEIRAIQPHAHYRARLVSASATLPDGARRPLILIRNWDFNWQDQYRYAAPFWVPAGTKLEMEYSFDNSDKNPRNPNRPPGRVSWGWRSSDEMADIWIQVMTRTESDRARLIGDVRRKMAAEDAIGCETLIARQPEYADLRNDAASLYLELGQPRDALRHFEAAARLQPQSAPAHYNVGVALEALGRTGEAAGQYEAALQLDQTYSRAHNNLGSLRLADGRFDEARREFERAVESGPDNAEAHNNLGAVLLAAGEAAASIRELERAIRLRPTYPEAHFNLARAYASTRQMDAAIRSATLAEAQAREAGKIDLIARIREQLQIYRAGVKE
jgi:tetratricopeptide (TPR) repeat protein/mono/diheme cytochrome c family protein